MNLLSQTDYALVFASPIGKLGIQIVHDKVAKLDILPESVETKLPNSTLGQLIIDELNLYFSQATHQFSLPLFLQGTSFQQQVWQALTRIPAGQPKTYGLLAKELNTSPRSIGGACRNNPLPIFIPCHRIIACKSLGGFNGATDGNWLQIKRWLLQHEGFSIS